MVAKTSLQDLAQQRIDEMDRSARAFISAWALALIFYVLEYSTRSAPGVMIPQLERAFASDGVGVGNILGTYYYTYSITSLVAGLALDRYGAKYVVPVGASVLGIGLVGLSAWQPWWLASIAAALLWFDHGERQRGAAS